MGNKNIVESTYKAFITWTPIRQKIIQLASKGQINMANELSLTKSDEQVKQLKIQIQSLITFARSKAKEYQTTASHLKQESTHNNLIVTISFILILLFLMLYVYKLITKAEKIISQKEEVIEQNIMIVTLDTKFHVQSASKSFCHFLTIKKEEYLNDDFFSLSKLTSFNTHNEDLKVLIESDGEWYGELKTTATKDAKWLGISILPITKNNNEVQGYTCIFTDITNKKLSGEDQLTSLLNRRMFDKIIEQELKTAKRNKTPLSLAIIDVDYFKPYNEHYGHPQGDKALQQVAKVLAHSAKRPNDYIFRIGGEEFAIIFSNLSQDESKKFLKSICLTLEAQQIEHKKSKINDFLTISIGGYIYCPTLDESQSELYERADRALYKAKESRNCTVIHSTETKPQ